MASKAATAAAVDFPRLISSLKLGRETVASLNAFRKRFHDAQMVKGQLASQPTSVDINYYRSVLKNQDVVNQAEKLLSDFKPVTYDVRAHVKAIEAFEAKAVIDVGNAHPEIFKAIDTSLTKGKWTVPGYNEKFGNLALM
ncbi:mitochondrial ATP synthase [Auriculariales sp. MPI-PUGE-AT-0066]|nr:mitochondrial ATP synthase [Auriculariales sp. MPI-PUGE-AT-0066]